MDDLWLTVQEAWYAIHKTKATAQSINGRTFVHTKKSTNAILKGLF